MSETGNEEQKKPLSEIKNFLRRPRTSISIVRHGNYDKHVKPQEYDEYMRRSSREKLGIFAAKIMRDHINTPSDKKPKVLDIAAGTGIISEVLKKNNFNVTATDLSVNLLQFLSEQNPDINTVQSDMNKELPFDDNSFDGVTIFGANRYIKDPKSFLNEVQRILTPGGVFIWPIFPAETALWKFRSGLSTHTSIDLLADDASSLGLSVVDKIKYTTDSGKAPVIAPTFLVLKK